jgi:DNA-binding NarL/FixJ family response regulator
MQPRQRHTSTAGMHPAPGVSLIALIEPPSGADRSAQVGKEVVDAITRFLDGRAPGKPGTVAILHWQGGPSQKPPLVPATGRTDLVEPLSKRELEVLHLLAAGLSNSAIAAELFLSVGTVKQHLHHINGKLGTKSRTSALARARELGLI